MEELLFFFLPLMREIPINGRNGTGAGEIF